MVKMFVFYDHLVTVTRLVVAQSVEIPLTYSSVITSNYLLIYHVIYYSP